MRGRDYLRFAARTIRRWPLRSGLTIAALTMSAIILTALVALSLGTRQALVGTLSPDGSLTNIVVTATKSTPSNAFGSAEELSQTPQILDDNAVTSLRRIAHVEAVSPTSTVWELHDFRVVGTSRDFVAQAQGIDPGPAADPPIRAGQNFAPHESGHVAVLGYAYAKELGFANNPEQLLGKSITLTTQPGYRGDGATLPNSSASADEFATFAHHTTTLTATIVGVTGPGSDENSLLLPLDWVRKIRTQYSWERQPGASEPSRKAVDQIATQGYSAILVRADSASSVRVITTDIEQRGFGTVSTLDQVDRVMQFSTIMWLVLGSIALIALVAAALGVANTMLMSAAEQRYVVGVLRACGARRGVIARLFLTEAALLGLIGGALGTIGGVIVAELVDRQVSRVLSAQNLPIAHVVALPWWLLGLGVVTPILFGVVAGLYPALAAARQDPASVLNQP